jgi:hypothetical protein
MGTAVKIAQILSLCVVVVAICILSIYGRLAGEAATMLGVIAGYLSQSIREDNRPGGKPA